MPPTSTVPSDRSRPVSLAGSRDDLLGARAEPGAEGGGKDVERRLGQVADGVDELDLLHVHLVGDEVGVGQEPARPGRRHRQG